VVRPNQIISSDISQKKLTFIMFARNEQTVKRRVVLLNFPSKLRDTVMGSFSPDDAVDDVEQITSGTVNRYAVTVNTEEV